MLFSRVAFHYGIGYRELKALPMKTFWMLNKNISRLLAEMDMRALTVATTVASSGDAVNEAHGRLVREFDNPYKVDPVTQLDDERDEAGFAALKSMTKRR